MKTLVWLHKWLSVVVFIQLLVWLGTGLYFNLRDEQKAQGNIFRVNNIASSTVDADRLVPIASLIESIAQRNKKPILSVKLIWVNNQWAYLLSHQQVWHSYYLSDVSLVNAYSGQPLVINNIAAQRIASTTYNGEGKVVSNQLLTPPIDDLPKEQNPVWRIQYNDGLNTSIYVRANSGALVSHANDQTRFDQLMFRLHFMDYANTGSFNHPLIIVFALLTFILSFTGFIWLIIRVKEGQLRLFFSQGVTQFSVVSVPTNVETTVLTDSNDSLLESIKAHHIQIKNSCGGGGSCGQCIVQLEGKLNTSIADKEQLSLEQRKQGFRLACQQRSAGIKRVVIS